MNKFTLILIVLFFSNLAALAQTADSPDVNWERYAFKNQGFSVSLPKLPVLDARDDYTRSEETRRYGAYANGVAYVVAYSQEAKDNPLKKTQTVEPFGAANFQARLAELRGQLGRGQDKFVISESSANSWQLTQLVGEESVYKLYFNPKTNAWVELWAISPNDSKTEAENFFNSLKFEKNPPGRDAGEGGSNGAKVSPEVKPSSGEPTPNNNQGGGTGIGRGKGAGFGSGTGNPVTPNAVPVQTGDAVKTKPVRVILTPRPKYTEEARKNNVSGSVLLRVTFSSSGQVSGVSVIRGLPFGLTESAIAAARKVLFVPAKKGDERVTTTRTLDFGFAIY